MAQHDFVINNQGFPSFRSDLNDFLNAVRTSHSGTSLPSGAVAGTIWLDTTNATTPILKYYDGTDNITLATINHSTNTVDFNDSAISTPLTVTGNATAGAELRLPEDTDNGTNYIALKAPDTIASNLTLTLPSTDGTVGQVLQTNGSGVLSFATVGGLAWQSVQTTGFTASANKGYPCNTTSSAFTVTLPASASIGDTIILVDYANTFATNNLTINPNGLKIGSLTSNAILLLSGTAISLTYIDSTQGWLISSDGVRNSAPVPYSVDFLVVAGGGAGGGVVGGGGGAGGYRTSTQTLYPATVVTVTVGAGGTGAGYPSQAQSGSNSSISGSNLTTITSAGGGGGGGQGNPATSASGGSGGGASSVFTTQGTGNTPSTSPSQGNDGGTASVSAPCTPSGGGGGAGAVGGNGSGNIGGNGGNGTASSITGSSVTYAGGGGGGVQSGAGTNGTEGSGGTGGGGAGGVAGANSNGTNGTANLGGGGGGGTQLNVGTNGGSGGSGVVILSLPTSRYSGIISGAPTVTTSGSNTILKFTGSGTYTG
jgi:hypothetical protein